MKYKLFFVDGHSYKILESDRGFFVRAAGVDIIERECLNDHKLIDRLNDWHKKITGKERKKEFIEKIRGSLALEIEESVERIERKIKAKEA